MKSIFDDETTMAEIGKRAQVQRGLETGYCAKAATGNATGCWCLNAGHLVPPDRSDGVNAKCPS